MNGPSTRAVRCKVPQRGSFLLEGMIALFIFSFGILGLVGMMASSIRSSNDARFRVEALNLASAMIGDMWNTRNSTLDTEFGATGDKLAAWRAEAARLLPLASGANAPVVDLTQAGISSQSRSVVVTVYWQLPGSPQRHQVLMTAQIGRTT